MFIPPQTGRGGALVGGLARTISRQPPKGDATRSTTKQFTIEVKAVVKPIEDVVRGGITRLIGTQSGVDGFVLRSIKTVTASNLSGTQKDLEVVDQNGVSFYWTVFPTKA